MSQPSGEEADLRRRIESFAKEHGYGISKDAPKVISGLLKRKEKYGNFYCPCRVVHLVESIEDEQVNKGIECPCRFVHEEVAAKGRCHCNLFTRAKP